MILLLLLRLCCLLNSKKDEGEVCDNDARLTNLFRNENIDWITNVPVSVTNPSLRNSYVNQPHLTGFEIDWPVNVPTSLIDQTARNIRPPRPRPRAPREVILEIPEPINLDGPYRPQNVPISLLDPTLRNSYVSDRGQQRRIPENFVTVFDQPSRRQTYSLSHNQRASLRHMETSRESDRREQRELSHLSLARASPSRTYPTATNQNPSNSPIAEDLPPSYDECVWGIT